MKRLFVLLTLTITIVTTPSIVVAQVSSDGHTAREEAEGKDIWEKLQGKQLECKSLTDDNFESLGEYFMGQFIGNTERHAAMNQMMINMMGKTQEEQMHIILGKRSSGCNTNAKLPSGFNFMPLMWMMGGGGNPMMGYGGWNNMMGGWGSFGLGWVFMILFWALIILGIIAVVKWLLSGGRTDSSRTPLDILKERFVRGEIDKKEYEEKAKILSKSR